MLKLILVDDEWIILKGLETTYDWGSMGCEVAGTATSAEAALELIKEKQPDVVITDIQMQEMSGLEILEKGKQIKEDLQFIIMSAYRDFEYARIACERGAFSYLLKPIEEEKLEQVMGELQKKISKETALQKEHENWRQLLLEENIGLSGILLQKYFKNMISSEEFSRLMGLMGYELCDTSCFAIVCADLDIGYKLTEQLQYEMNRYDLFHTLMKELKKVYDLWAVYGEDCWLYILRLRPGQELKIIEEIISDIRKRTEYPIISVVTPVYAGGEGLKHAYGQAVRLFSIANAASAAYFKAEKENEKETSSDIYSEYAEQFIISAFRSNDKVQLQEAYKKYIDLLPSGKEEAYIKSCLCHLISNVGLMLENSYGMNDEIRGRLSIFYEKYRDLSALKMVDVIYQLLTKILEIRIDVQPEIMNSYFSGYVNRAQEYIEANIANPDLSIGDVAQEVYLNQVYFGRMFKNACGVSFKRYLLNRRIELAKNLLQENCSISEICEKVGIWNPSYFSQVFKQTVGCLPSEFRKQEKEF
ncbi:response regulator [Lachnospiraceae bacterium 64-25]